MNPLDPCGACMEWLKKIGEVNPDFKVVTFADSNTLVAALESVAVAMRISGTTPAKLLWPCTYMLWFALAGIAYVMYHSEESS